MGIFRTRNPLEYAQVDGIVIDERAPDPAVQGVGTGIAILVGLFQRGPTNELTEVSGQAEVDRIFGRDFDFSGYTALVNKGFSRLRIIRVEATGSAKATLTLKGAGDVDTLTFTAKNPGAYGNNINVVVDGTSGTTRTYTIGDGTNEERYALVEIADIQNALMGSNIVDVELLSSAQAPTATTGAMLEGGADGTATDTDYATAIGVAAAERAGNFIFLDDYNPARNALLKAHVEATQDKMAICAGPENETVQEAITAVAALRDTDGRIIYAYNWIQTRINGNLVFTSPASWMASVMSQIAPHIDPSFSDNTRFLGQVVAVKRTLTRNDAINFVENGIASFEFDGDIGFKIKSGVVTQIANSELVTIIRRRMADYLTNSIARFLKLYQGAPNRRPNMEAIKAAILNFVLGQETAGILPPDSEVADGVAKVVDIDSLNTNESIAAGRFTIIYKQRIFSSMRFIILRAEIGQGVVVTENN